MRLGLIGTTALIFLALQPSARATPVLERVVMVSRHGVRSPTRTVDVLNTLTKRGWPEWPVKAGEMTEHGAKNLRFMADFLRRTYTDKGLLPAEGCPVEGAVVVWSDVLDHRTRQSGDIFAESLAPGCRVSSKHAAPGTLDPVFDASKSSACPVGLLTRGAALAAAAEKPGGLLRPDDRQALQKLQEILAPEACKTGAGLCLLPANASSMTNAASLALGAIVAEGLYLQYAQGFPAAEVGWGKAGDAETISAIMPIHEHGINLLSRMPALAGRQGAVMARTILALLQARPMPAGAPNFSSDATVVMLAGHDSNLLYMAALMGLHWTLPDQPTMTAPDTTIAFEVWHEPGSDQRTLKVVVYAQTLAQLRNASPLGANSRPDIVAAVPEACAASGVCDLAMFSGSIERKLAALCSG